MKKLTQSEAYRADYDLSFINCLRQSWRWGRAFSCLDAPKRQSLLIHLYSCSAVYTVDGVEYFAEAGDVVYCPTGSRYEMHFVDFDDSASYTVGINFRMLICGEETVLSDTPIIFKCPPRASELFSRILALEGTTEATPAGYKALLFRLLSTLLGDALHKTSREYSIVKPGYEYMLAHPYENLSVDHLASLCFISSAYFRRLFRSVFSTSPKEMLVRMRLERAKQYLEFSDESVAEISTLLGYYDPSSFIREFKMHYGTSPLQYRMKNKL